MAADATSAGEWAGLKKVLETEGVSAAFKQWTGGSNATQATSLQNPFAQLAESAHRRLTEQVQSIQTDFSCGFFHDGSQKKGESRVELHEDSYPGVYAGVETSQVPPSALSLRDVPEDPPKASEHLQEEEPYEQTYAAHGAKGNVVDLDLPVEVNIEDDQTTECLEEFEELDEEGRHVEQFQDPVVPNHTSDCLDEARSCLRNGEEESLQRELTENLHDEASNSVCQTPVVRDTVLHQRKPTAAGDWITGSFAQEYDQAFHELDEEFKPEVGAMQVVGCVVSNEELHLDKPAWLVSADGGISIIDAGNCEPWIWNFAAGKMEIAVHCRSGQGRAGTNQDNFSITQTPHDTGIYIVCDGHGSFGHLVAFRAVQTLPRFILQGLSQCAQLPVEQVIATAFRSANVDLQKYAGARNLDFSSSGASCSVVVRQRQQVHVAWLGDSRALVASVAADGGSQVDLFSAVHDVDQDLEQSRLVSKGAELHITSDEDGLRIGAPNHHGSPGLAVSRALGDFAMTPHGLLAHPDLAKTSFAEVPGFVLLASSGLCAFQESGESVAELLIDGGGLLQNGPQGALGYMCDAAQRTWLESHGFCDDVSGLLLNWSSSERTIECESPAQIVAGTEEYVLPSCPTVSETSNLSAPATLVTPTSRIGTSSASVQSVDAAAHETSVVAQVVEGPTVVKKVIEGPVIVKKGAALHPCADRNVGCHSIQQPPSETHTASVETTQDSSARRVVPEGPVFSKYQVECRRAR
jgi:serine/threonine protein phosphatase PrpC